MNNTFVLILANMEVAFAWLGTTSFIVAFHLGSPLWHVTPLGRAMMHRAASMWLLLSFALTARLLEFAPDVRNAVALVIYLMVGLMEWRLWAVLRYIQKGKITIENPQYAPIKNWWRNRKFLRKRGSK